jgi:hypothetical protein
VSIQSGAAEKMGSFRSFMFFGNTENTYEVYPTVRLTIFAEFRCQNVAESLMISVRKREIKNGTILLG